MEKDVNFDKYRAGLVLVEDYLVNDEGRVFSRPDHHNTILPSELPTRRLHPGWAGLAEKIKEYFNLESKILKPYNIIELPLSTQDIEALYEGLSVQWFLPGDKEGFTLNIYPYGKPVLLRHMSYKEPHLVFLVQLSTNAFDAGHRPNLN